MYTLSFFLSSSTYPKPPGAGAKCRRIQDLVSASRQLADNIKLSLLLAHKINFSGPEVLVRRAHSCGALAMDDPALCDGQAAANASAPTTQKFLTS